MMHNNTIHLIHRMPDYQANRPYHRPAMGTLGKQSEMLQVSMRSSFVTHDHTSLSELSTEAAFSYKI